MNDHHSPDTAAIEEAIFAEVQSLNKQTMASIQQNSISAKHRHKLFVETLLAETRSGVIFVDKDGEIESWNQALELMTGLSANNMVGNILKPSLLSLADSEGHKILDRACPIQSALTQGQRENLDVILCGRSGRTVQAEMVISPVFDKTRKGSPEQDILGAVIQIHDSSVQHNMLQKLKDLYQVSSLDPLTRVANRAKFETTLDEYATAHRRTGKSCCLIICDIDFFKKINDNYGHHIGDQALIAFSQLLKSSVRNHDVVARYGGEEFVILCANCDVDGGVEKAEEIRVLLNQTPQQMLNGKTITASFGVAELKETESVTDLFVRADQALYFAKENGRNQVVRWCENQLDQVEKATEQTTEVSRDTGIKWRKRKNNLLFCEEFRSVGPEKILMKKLACYLHEFRAPIRKKGDDFVMFEITERDFRNESIDEVFPVTIEFQPGSPDVGGNPTTLLRISIEKPKKRWFKSIRPDLYAQAILNLRRYLMIADDSSLLKSN